MLRRGAAGRGRTGTVFTPRDFKSRASAYSATTATVRLYITFLRSASAAGKKIAPENDFPGQNKNNALICPTDA